MKVATILIAIAFIAILLFLLNSHFFILSYDKGCLEDIGKTVCEEKGMVFVSAITDAKRAIMFCKDDLRSVEFEKFRYLDSELKQCRKGGD